MGGRRETLRKRGFVVNDEGGFGLWGLNFMELRCRDYPPLAKMADLHASREECGTVNTSLYRGVGFAVDMVEILPKNKSPIQTGLGW